MKKKQWMIPLSALITVGLAGCANDNNGAMDNNNAASPMGYYSNENHQNGNNGFLRDNDGPLPEVMDHTFGAEGQLANNQSRRQLQVRNENGNPANPTRPLADHDHNFFQRDNRFSTSDANYHGHLNQRIGMTGTATNPEFQDNATGQIKRQVAAVDNVQQVRSVLWGNSVVIAVILENNDQEKETKRAIQNAVKPFVGGRSVQVLTDEGILGRDRNGPDHNRNNDIQHYEHNGNKEVKNPSP